MQKYQLAPTATLKEYGTDYYKKMGVSKSV